MTYAIGLIILSIVILDGLCMWVIDAPLRDLGRRVTVNILATIIGGVLIWLS